jgi:hypothetical protein
MATEVIERLRDAQNRHDPDAFVACFDPEYRSEQPVHPGRAFVGGEQVRRNWAEVFAGVPDFHADLLRSVRQGDSGWAEWHWRGTRPDGTRAADGAGSLGRGWLPQRTTSTSSTHALTTATTREKAIPGTSQ